MMKYVISFTNFSFLMQLVWWLEFIFEIQSLTLISSAFEYNKWVMRKICVTYVLFTLELRAIYISHFSHLKKLIHLVLHFYVFLNLFSSLMRVCLYIYLVLYCFGRKPCMFLKHNYHRPLPCPLLIPNTTLVVGNGLVFCEKKKQ